MLWCVSGSEIVLDHPDHGISSMWKRISNRQNPLEDDQRKVVKTSEFRYIYF